MAADRSRTTASPAPTVGPGWPLTVVARWSDPGYPKGETRSLLALTAAACLWPVMVILILERTVSPQLLGLSLVIGAWLARRVYRGRRADLELTLEPERLRIGGSANTPAVQLARRDAGWLLASETGLDWNERLVLLTDAAGREVARLRALPAALEIHASSSAGEAWWAANMPPGTGPGRPPATVSVTALLGAWWPSDRRASVRGTMAVRRSWREGDLAGYEAWDRRERRRASLIGGGALLFMYALAIPATWPLTLAEMIAYLPPGVLGLALAIRGLVR